MPAPPPLACPARMEGRRGELGTRGGRGKVPSKHGRKECYLLRIFFFFFGLSGFGPELQSPGSEVSLCFCLPEWEKPSVLFPNPFTQHLRAHREGLGRAQGPGRTCAGRSPPCPAGAVLKRLSPVQVLVEAKASNLPGRRLLQGPRPAARVTGLTQKPGHCPPFRTVHTVFVLSLKCD